MPGVLVRGERRGQTARSCKHTKPPPVASQGLGAPFVRGTMRGGLRRAPSASPAGSAWPGRAVRGPRRLLFPATPSARGCPGPALPGGALRPPLLSRRYPAVPRCFRWFSCRRREGGAVGSRLGKGSAPSSPPPSSYLPLLLPPLIFVSLTRCSLAAATAALHAPAAAEAGSAGRLWGRGLPLAML